MVQVLIAEDVGAISLALEDTLQDGGYTVAGPFASRESASAWLRDHTPDVALLDLVLRDGPCLEVARLLQERNVPTVFLSGQMRDASLPDDLQRLPWIEKPVRFDQLLGALAQVATEKTPTGAESGSSQSG
jgi:DNA-binding response OmpR family regulator